jgi:Uri superfamily endonuclease
MVKRGELGGGFWGKSKKYVGSGYWKESRGGRDLKEDEKVWWGVDFMRKYI